jgi:hypothetical protein
MTQPKITIAASNPNPERVPITTDPLMIQARAWRYARMAGWERDQMQRARPALLTELRGCWNDSSAPPPPEWATMTGAERDGLMHADPELARELRREFFAARGLQFVPGGKV